ncbi:heat shock protein 90kDa beta [Nesidiocoris tenuis]|uniref:Heat shock protein 83 n=1 Tax=Nesidiocoris tenuis TaxID=355587 RepID=A0ABN7BDN2_9HEMI|nr:heat shock protein 90kDa beta [Nesidiocoris tenuis]
MLRSRLFLLCGLFLLAVVAKAEDEVDSATVTPDLGSHKEGSRTDDDVVKREEEAIKLDGLSVAEIKRLREQAEKFTFQAEVNRMMKLIINSLYRNKDIFLRELISNGSDALDKIRLLSLTEKGVLESNPDLNVKIKADEEGRVLHITDSGIGMTKQDLVNNLGTIAKSGTAEFLNKMQESGVSGQDTMDMIGQFGVGFYSSFLVADRVVVTTKHNDDDQYIWESDASSFSITKDPRGPTLKRGTTISLYLKEEAKDYLEVNMLRNLVKKYSQFINFPIYLWANKEVEVDEPIEEDEKDEKDEQKDEEKTAEDDVDVEEGEPDEDKPKTKKVKTTVWEWEKLNDNKPIWTRKPADVTDDEYTAFYKALTKDTSKPLTHIHFFAEGEVSFKSLLFAPATQPSDTFNKYGTQTDNLKLYVRRVFITDEFTDLLPKYLSFLQGIVDSDDLPLNVSRETLQQHKLLKVIKKKLIRKALDMFKKLPKDEMAKFWKEYSTNIKLGIIEDPANRTRLAKLLMFLSSNDNEFTNLADYISRMKPKQEHIYYMAGTSREEVRKSPFVERLLKKGYEVLFLVEAVDEYTISALPEFDGKKFQNVAKEGLVIPEDEDRMKAAAEKFEPLTKWLAETALKNEVSKVVVSARLTDSPCALVASMFGWSGNMERLALSNAHQKSDGSERGFYMNQKKILEINPRHALIQHLLNVVNENPEDSQAKDLTNLMFKTATLRSGYLLKDTSEYASSVEKLLMKTLNIPESEMVYEEEEEDDATGETAQELPAEDENAEDHDEL